jgi:ABC-2 type transport system permease protein
MVLFVIYAFTLSVFSQATGTSNEVNNASIAFADEDGSALSAELFNAFYPPASSSPSPSPSEIETPWTGALHVRGHHPARFERDLRRDATPRSSSASTPPPCSRRGSAPATSGTSSPTAWTPTWRARTWRSPALNLVVRKLFNPNGVSSWFQSIVAIINQLTLLTIVLTGAAVIREREHGTLEHLLVMPLSAFEIAMAKVWANGW